jgi:hexosaminidase
LNFNTFIKLPFQLAWLKLVEQKGGLMPKKFCGTILTGWQRYDHFASLCELLPAAIPSLCCCLAALDARNFGDSELDRCSNELGLNLRTEQFVFQNPDIRVNPTFPGSNVYLMVKEFAFLKSHYDEVMRGDLLPTWYQYYKTFFPSSSRKARN